MNLPDAHFDHLYNIGIAVRYHMRRQAFFERWHRLTGIVSLIGGSAAFATITTPDVAKVFAASIAIVQAVDLMVDTRKYAELHKDLRRRYLTLEASLGTAGSFTEEDHHRANHERKLIESEEPPIRQVLVALCQNQTLEVIGLSPEERPESYTKVGFIKRLTAQFW